jgi:hypothetical protein
MALFDEEGSVKTLADALGSQATTAKQGIENSYAMQRKKLIGQQAHAGRLTSGVAEYPMGDLAGAEVGDLGGVDSALAGALGNVSSQDYLSTQEYQRNLALAEMIGKLNHPSGLQGALGGALSGAAAGGSVGGPWGALAGGVAGGAGGYYASQQE